MFDNAYEALTEEGDARWAFGTGFADPLSGVDTTVPSGVDGAELAAYCLMLGDDALIMSHRLQEWCTRAPELEDEVAIANIGLDLLGQARLLLARAGKADGTDRGEDEFAFLRTEQAFRNVRLVEVGNADFAFSMARLLVFATWRLALLQRLVDSVDPVLAAIAAKGVKEVAYHRDYAARWVVRLGDGTELSHQRMQNGLTAVWPYVGELFTGHPVESRIGVDPAELRAEFDAVLAQVLTAATLQLPETPALATVLGRSGRDGVHTEEMGYLLAELQSVARAHPDATW
ncbi:phenylacetate-CoA oxygenase subunit PaaC [Kutzneria viridogrisea]|uniref:Phenylacetic acid degradation protein PaaC n=2 Tax=Kutzneria TaxID=43356 RepID=W5W4S4_9PSEU|nr:1,2-phenylacetyl-CoA epoxidase subunit PaaC [Kutzneria albida]AHH95476.1 phenylacetic acid degradation protein PaaC [Kutzneria albida DSM 43870]MBA8927165.1 ring-1,2-phenylacetyl-CoA epoxidase subunit PaaC [Kutzneria viridogrisea]